jgi:hypothetical protein
VSNGSGARLLAKVGSDVVTCPKALDPLGGLRSTTCLVAPDPASLQGGLRAPAHPAPPCGSWASSTKKSLADLPVRQGSSIPNASAHVSKAPDVRAMMDLQDVRAGIAVSAYKTCGQTATVQR